MSNRVSLPLYPAVFEDVLLCGLWLKHHIEGEGPQFGPALGLINLTTRVHILSLRVTDIVDYDTFRQPHVAWRAVIITNLCHKPPYPQSGTRLDFIGLHLFPIANEKQQLILTCS